MPIPTNDKRLRDLSLLPMYDNLFSKLRIFADLSGQEYAD